MEQSTTGHDAVDDGMLSVHRWRVSQLTRLGIPGTLVEIRRLAGPGLPRARSSIRRYAASRLQYRDDLLGSDDGRRAGRAGALVMGAAPSRSGTDAPDGRGRHGERW
jgi:hypothetical protein